VISRRELLRRGALAAGALVLPPGVGACVLRPPGWRPPAIFEPDPSAPDISAGVASGDPGAYDAMVWSRCDRPARMLVEWSTRPDFADAEFVLGPDVSRDSDFTGQTLLTRLPPDSTIHYRVRFKDLSIRRGLTSEPAVGRLRTAPEAAAKRSGAPTRDVFFAWSGDVAGQGWGIDEARGGMLGFEAVRLVQPDFFVHCGDAIYADGPLEREVRLEDGTVWRNLMTPAKAKVAESLAEFHGCFAYNRLDAHVRAFSAEVPVVGLWDDHEVRNNWWPGQVLDDARYNERVVSILAARARQAFLDYTPLRRSAEEPERLHRRIAYGPLLDLFALDARSFRGPNSHNDQRASGRDTAFLGEAQVDWLAWALATSRATWKVVACDMPLGLVVRDADGFEAVANGDPGPPRGRELEIARLLRKLREARVRNVVWITADVHQAAAHHYHPERAHFHEFDPFWEFVAGPLHAGTFAPPPLDPTFGPERRFCAVPRDLRPNRPPSDGMQFFGTVRIDGKSRALRVALHDLSGRELYAETLAAA
jgi:alkaline phosphatase D